jgi:hypothetical protein
MIFSSFKYFKVLKTLDQQELKSFEQWLKSPWANKSKKMIVLLAKVKKYYPTFEDEKMTRIKLFRQVLPKGRYSDQQFNNVLSEGYFTLQKFLIFNSLKKNENLQRELLVDVFHNHHLEDWFFREMPLEIEALESKPIKDWEDHLGLFQMHRRIYHHPNQKMRMEGGNQTLQKMEEQLDILYLLEKAVILNEKIFRQRIMKNEDYEIDKALKIWLAQSEEYIDHLTINLYRKRFLYKEETLLEQFMDLRTIFLERYQELNTKEQKVHLFSLLNDTSYLIRKGAIKSTEALVLYKLGLETKLLLNKGKITLNSYISIVGVSNKKKDFAFTELFIETYTSALPKDIQMDAYHWAKAHTQYKKGNSRECLDLLINHHFKNQTFQVLTRTLNTQAYFDLHLEDDSYDSFLFSYLDAFEKWLGRNNIDKKTNKSPSLRFVQITRMLAKAYLKEPAYFEKVKDLYHTENNIHAKEWLKEKIDNLSKSKRKRSFF